MAAKRLFIMGFVFAAFNLAAQITPKTITLAANSGYGTSIFFNSNMLDDTRIKYSYLNSCFSFGARVGYQISGDIELAVELSRCRLGQYFYLNTDSIDYQKEISYVSFDKYFLFRIVGGEGGYFEIGPRISSISKLEVDNSSNYDIVKTEKNFKGFSWGMITSFGLGLYYNKYIDINFGVRLGYDFSDLMKNGYYPPTDNIYTEEYAAYESYTGTHPLTVQFMLDINWHIGYFSESGRFFMN